MKPGIAKFIEDNPDLTAGQSDAQVAGGMYQVFLDAGGDPDEVSFDNFKTQIGYAGNLGGMADVRSDAPMEQLAALATPPSEIARLTNDPALGAAIGTEAGQTAPDLPAEIGSAFGPTLHNVYPRLRESFGGMMEAIGASTGNVPLEETGEYMAEDARGEMFPVPDTGFPLEKYGAMATGAGLTMAPAIGAAVTAGVPTAAGVIAAQVFGPAYNKGRDNGLDHGGAFDYATLHSAAEAIPAMLPLGMALKMAKKGELAKKIGLVSATEAAQESLTEALQFAIDKGSISPEMSWGDLPERVKDAAIVGAMLGPVIGGAGQAVQRSKADAFERDSRNAISFDPAAVDAMAMQGTEQQAEGKQIQVAADPTGQSIEGEISDTPVSPDVVDVQESAINIDPEAIEEQVAIKAYQRGESGETIAKETTEQELDAVVESAPAEAMSSDQRVILQDAMAAQEYKPEAIMGGAMAQSVPGNLREKSGGSIYVRPKDYRPSTPDTLFSFEVPESAAGNVDNMAASIGGPLQKWRPFFDMSFAGIQAATVEPGETGTIELANGPMKIPTVDSPARRDSIRLHVERLIGRRIYTGQIQQKELHGYHIAKGKGVGTVRTKKFNNPEVMMHEVAHYMHRFNKPTKDVFDEFSYKVPEFAYSDMDGDRAGQRSEGLAEFVRLWMTQYPYMKRLEPDLVSEFDSIVESLPKKPRKLFYTIQEAAHGHYWQGAVAQNEAAIGDPLTRYEHFLDYQMSRPVQNFRAKAIDEFYAIQVIQGAVGTADQDAAHDAYKQAQLSYGASAIHKAVVEKGAIEYIKPGEYAFTGKGLQEIFEPAAKHGEARMKLLMRYMVALRSTDLAAEGRENRLNEEGNKKNLELGEEYPEFKEIAADFKEFNDAMLDWYVAMGSIAPAQRDAYQEFANYLPFVRWKQESGSTLGKRLTGGQGNLNDPMENIMSQLFINIRNANINLSRRTMYEDIQSNEAGAVFATPIPMKTEAHKVAQEQMAKKIAALLAESGMMVNSEGQIVEIPEGGEGSIAVEEETMAALEERPWMMTFFDRVAPTVSKEVDTTIDSYLTEGGEVQYMEVNDPLLRDLVEMGGQPDLGRVARFAIRTKGVVTRAITVPIQFMAPNMVRDIWSGSAVTRNIKQIPVIDPVMGMYDYFSKNKNFQDAMLHGAGFAGVIDSGRIAENQYSSLKVKRNKAEYLLPWVLAAKAWQGLEYVAGGFEYATRGGEYRAARRAGKSKSEAAWEAREISTDFAKHGNGEAWTTYQRTVPFMQASINGIDKTMRMFFQRDGQFHFKNAAQIDRAHARFYMMWAGVGAFTIAQYLRYGDEDWFEQLPIDQKARFMWFGADNKAPLPYDIGSIFATLPLAVMMAFDEKGKEAAKLMGFSLTSMFGVGSMPAFIAPLWELSENRDWRGSPITPPRAEGLPAAVVKGPRTKILYEGMADAFSFPELELMAKNNDWETISKLFAGLNAYQWEHLVKGYFGYMADYAADATEALLWDKEKWGDKPFPVELTDYVNKQFVGPKATFRTKYTTGFYAMQRRANDAAKELRVYEDQMEKRGLKWDDVFPESMAVQAATLIQGGVAAKQLQKVSKEISKRRKALDDIYYDKRLTRQEKEQRMEAEYSAINRAAKTAYEWVKRDVIRAEEVLESGYGEKAMRLIYKHSERARNGN